MTSGGFGWIAECVAPGRVGPALRSRLRTFDPVGVGGDGWMRVSVVGAGAPNCVRGYVSSTPSESVAMGGCVCVS